MSSGLCFGVDVSLFAVAAAVVECSPQGQNVAGLSFLAVARLVCWPQFPGSLLAEQLSLFLEDLGHEVMASHLVQCHLSRHSLKQPLLKRQKVSCLYLDVSDAAGGMNLP